MCPGYCEPALASPPPFPKLLPRLHELLDGTRWWERLRVDDGALPVGTLIDLPHTVLAQNGHLAHDLLEILSAPDLFLLAEIRTPGHTERFYKVRHLFATPVSLNLRWHAIERSSF